MNTVPAVREAAYRQILRHQGAVFQSAEIRQELGWSEESPEARRLHAIIQSLKQEGVITQTGTARRRNQYLMLAKPDELRLRAGRFRSKEPASNGKIMDDHVISKPGPQRVRYLEEHVNELEERVAGQGDKLDEILRTLGEIGAKVDELHREWVTSA